MAIKKTNVKVQITLPRKVDDILGDIVKSAQEEGKLVTKSSIINDALLLLFDYCGEAYKLKNSKDNKEEN